MSLVKAALPPGMLRVGTIYQAQRRWYRGNLCRSRNDGGVYAVEPIGGWAERTVSAMTGKARAAIAWVDNDNLRWQAYGTNSKLYALTQTSDTPVDITPVGFTAGDADATAGGGYGIGPYGESTYGTPRVDNASYQEAGMWLLDTFGEVLVAIMAEDSIAYSWTPPDTGVKAAAISGAPAGSALVVTPERFLMILGAGGDNRKVQWADQETLTTWTPTATNQAGDITLQSHGKLLCGKRVRGGTLLFTDAEVFTATYVGQPYIYGFERAGENCGIISRGAAIAVDTRCFWMGNGRFYVFDSVTRELGCEVTDGVFEDLNTTQRSKITSYHDPKFSEVWWFYPSAASTEIDRAVVFNYEGGFWTIHEDFARLCAIPRGVFNNPIMADSTGYVWDHETGVAYGGDTPYLESGPFELGDGDRLMKVRELVPDERTQGDVTVTLYGADTPNGTETTFGPYTMDDFVSIRANARQFRIKLTTAVAAAWRWGIPRFDVQPGGRR